MVSAFNLHPSKGDSFQTASISNQSLIELLNGKLASGADKIELSPDQVKDIIQGFREPEKSPPANPPESSATKELAILKQHCRLGDYAGRVFNDLKFHRTDAPLPKLATELVELLGKEGSDGPMATAIEVITYRIRDQGADIDSAMAKFAVEAYAARNLAVHGECGQLVMAEKWDDLPQRISLDLEALPEILPVSQIEHLQTWRRILCYYRDRYIVQVNGKWQKREEEDSIVQLPVATLRPGDRPIRGLPPIVASSWFSKGYFRADPVPFSSPPLLARQERSRSHPVEITPKRKASGPPVGDSALESPSKKSKKRKDPKSPQTAEEVHANAVWDLFAHIYEFEREKKGREKSLKVVRKMIKMVRVERGNHKTALQLEAVGGQMEEMEIGLW